MKIKAKMLILLVLSFFPIGLAYAQFDQQGTGDILISIRPDAPLPEEYVALSAASPMIDLEQSEITWYANRTVIAEGTGLTEAGVIAGPLGSETDVVVIAQPSGGASATGEIFIRPAEVDILWESDSYVPPFYKGRALPSAGTKLRVQAIARLKLQNGGFVPERDITYTWRRNGSVITSASGRGKSFAIFPAPALFGADLIEVQAISSDGALAGKGAVRIPSVEPALLMYENHPLFGIFYSKAFDRVTSVNDSEMTFATVPYFAPGSGPNDSQFEYNWRVNGQNIPADYIRPSEITIDSENSTGIADIAVTLTRARNWYMRASGEWKISFPSGGNGSGVGLFSFGNQ